MPPPFILVKDSVLAFIEDNALSRGAAIAFYAVTSIAPVLVIVIAVAGAAYGEDAARGAVAVQLGGLMGKESADLLQTAILHVSDQKSGAIASLFGLLTLLVTASGVFSETQAALNAIWQASPRAPPSCGWCGRASSAWRWSCR